MHEAVDRRSFLRSASLLGVAAATGVRVTRPEGEAIAPLTAAPPSAAQIAPFELDEATVDQLQGWMRSGKFSAQSIAEAYLARIEEIDRSGPRLKAVIEVNPDAVKIAADLDAERKAKGPRGPLHGIPVVLKDVVDTADRMHTTAGSLALMGSIPPLDAFIVERLRAAGAVILGKTNLSEWSYARSTRASSGWSARGGLTVNPYALDRSANGSSSGTAVAISANLSALGIGVETDGSIVGPSSSNGIVGMKPTVGLLSRSGLIPVSYSQDSPGPMCRTVKDAAILLSALTGVDGRDIATDDSRGHVVADYAAGLDVGALKGARIGILRRDYDSEAPEFHLMDQALDLIRSEGAILVDPIDIPSMDQIQSPEVTVMVCEFKDAIRDYLLSRGPDERHKSLGDLIDFNVEHADEEMRFFGQEWFEAAQANAGRQTPAYRPSLAECRRLTRTQGVDRVVQESQLDAIITLTGPPAFPIDLVNGDPRGSSNTALAAVSGYPSITVPLGNVMGLPVGISFVGPAWSEATLLRLAYAYEQASHARRAPRFNPTVFIDR